MSIDKIIRIAKGTEEEKIGMSIKIPMLLKNQLQKISKENSVSVNAIIQAMIEDSLNGNEKNLNNLEVVNKIESLQNKKSELERVHNEIGEDFLELTNGVVMDMNNEIATVKYMINLLQKGL